MTEEATHSETAGTRPSCESGEVLTHRDFEYIARFAKDLVVAVGRYGGTDGRPSFNEQQTLAGLRAVLATPRDRLFSPLYQVTREPQAISMLDRMAVAGVADSLIDDGHEERARILVDAVRCCGEFPECSHVLAEVMAMDNATATTATAEQSLPLQALPPTGEVIPPSSETGS